MRFSFQLAAALATSVLACGNTYHPEYHPQTSVSYSETSANPVHVQTGQAQPVYVTPAGAHAVPGTLPAPPPPPTPPEGFPW